MDEQQQPDRSEQTTAEFKPVPESALEDQEAPSAAEHDAPPAATDRSRIQEFRKLTQEKIKGRTENEHERVRRAHEAVDYEGKGEE